ncbi:MAG: GIY-YIG nuclease family protein [Candidatus Komeilibacteria bacterium]|nr:GIY-YIG nuclease family protein [Candidatus Komeilibacteria bacterium]
MQEERYYYVYIMASKSRILYVGMTNNLVRRVIEHKQGLCEGFTKKYHCYQLVYYESGTDVYGVIEREKQIKRWRRENKIFLIEMINPNWQDLSEEIGIDNADLSARADYVITRSR